VHEVLSVSSDSDVAILPSDESHSPSRSHRREISIVPQSSGRRKTSTVPRCSSRRTSSAPRGPGSPVAGPSRV
jgi:hypothetical protein